MDEISAPSFFTATKAAFRCRPSWNNIPWMVQSESALVAVKNEGAEISSIGYRYLGVDFALIAKDGSNSRSSLCLS